MEDIDFVHLPDGQVKVYTTTEPYMEVIAHSYAIGKSIIERNIVWLAERREAEAQKEIEAEILKMKTIEDKRLEDTAPSEIVATDHYMDGNQGC